ncbi:MAG: type II toxin-antitoxin system VapB family antitoxin [Desulfobacterales bacterium]|nr:type II toxin-antitoxin system VapB family antitoxin [Desulfobacterales bacterium]
MADAFSVSHTRTKKELIREALRELVRFRKREDLTKLAGKIPVERGVGHWKTTRSSNYYL